MNIDTIQDMREVERRYAEAVALLETLSFEYMAMGGSPEMLRFIADLR